MEKLAITIFPHPPKLKELLSACRMIAGQTLKETGCTDCRVTFGSGDGSTVQIEQHWRQRDHLENYFRSSHFNALMGAMKLLAIDNEITLNDGTPEHANVAIKNARGP